MGALADKKRVLLVLGCNMAVLALQSLALVNPRASGLAHLGARRASTRSLPSMSRWPWLLTPERAADIRARVR